SRLALRNLDVGAEQASLARLARALLRPVELAAFDVDGNAHAMFRLVRPGSRVALTCVNERLDVRTVEVRAHHAHALAVAPVELPGRLLNLKLFGRERAARRNDGRHVSSVEIRADDRAVIRRDMPHIRPRTAKTPPRLFWPQRFHSLAGQNNSAIHVII